MNHIAHTFTYYVVIDTRARIEHCIWMIEANRIHCNIPLVEYKQMAESQQRERERQRA